MSMQPDQLADMVRSAATPSFLLAAVGMQVRVLNNRLSRIVDRQQLLEHGAGPATQMRSAEVRHELDVLMRRRHAIHRAILLCSLAAMCVAGMIASLFLDNVMSAQLSALVAALFTTSMVCMVLSYLLFLGEIFISIRKLKLTIRGSRHLR